MSGKRAKQERRKAAQEEAERVAAFAKVREQRHAAMEEWLKNAAPADRKAFGVRLQEIAESAGTDREAWKRGLSLVEKMVQGVPSTMSDRTTPKVNARIQEFFSEFNRVPPGTCEHARGGVPLCLCFAHAELGLMCLDCAIAHHKTHTQEYEMTCDECGQVVEELTEGASAPTLALPVAGADGITYPYPGPVIIGSFGMCDPCMKEAGLPSH